MDGVLMLNEERIRLMTKMASYEAREGKEHMPIKQYYRKDYVSYELRPLLHQPYPLAYCFYAG